MANSTRARKTRRVSVPLTGLGIDAYGGVAVDPTENVKSLTEFANVRQDDLREAERRYNDLRAVHSKDMAQLRSESATQMAQLRDKHQNELNSKESSRIDSIRQVDREEVAKTAAQANLAIQTLAKQTTDLAATLQTQVATTAATAETRRQTDMSEMGKRVSALELSSSKGEGIKTVSDPQMEKLTNLVQAMATIQNRGSGKSSGYAAIGVFVVGGFAVLAVLIDIVVQLTRH